MPEPSPDELGTPRRDADSASDNSIDRPNNETTNDASNNGAADTYATDDYLASFMADDEPVTDNGTDQGTDPNSDRSYATDDYLASFLFDDEPAHSGLLDDDETEDMPLVTTAEQLGVEPDGEDARSKAIDRHELPTIPLPDDEEVDPKRTLPGSGGLDPNPDFRGGAGNTVPNAPSSTSSNAPEYTVPHIVPFQHTLVHVPGEERPHINRPAPPPPPAQRTVPQQAAYTQPNAGAGTIPRPGYSAPPRTVAQPQAPAGYIPGAQGPAGQAQLPKRRSARRRTILGCSPGCVMAFVGLFATFCGGLTLITLVLTATLGTQLEERLQAQVAQVDDYRNFESTFYYDRTGTVLYESFGEGRRTNVNYTDFPQHLINATVAIEDDSFWINPGFEIPATVRAFAQYVGLAEGVSGGSTITQQLVRNVLFDYEYRLERSPQRKVEEILLAILLTNRMSKEDVLGMYLNEIYYGNLAYGAEAAARTFFDKSVGELTLSESALLAALPQAPASLDPLNDDPAVQAAVNDRWRLVLDRMVETGYISNEERNQALAEGYSFTTPDAPLNAPHFVFYAQRELEDLMVSLGYTPEDVTRGGLQIFTTLDLTMNDMAQEAARSQVASLAANNVSNAAVLVLKPGTGEILAMVGSVDYNNEAIDGNVNVTISPRQPGSTMKPFTYSAAMELGFTPGDIIWDTPTDIAGYVPRNYDGVFHGPMRLRRALANSYNIPAVQTLRATGVENLLAIMQRFGVESLGTDASQYGLSLTLGGGEVSLLELTRAYTVFPNGGVLVPSTGILCVLDGEDNIIYQYENSCPRGNLTNATTNRAGYGTQVLDPRIAYIMTDIMADNGARSEAMGANSPLNTGNIGASVKTGTTNDIKDNWTVGYTRNVAVGVWVGNSNGDPMVNSSGLTGAAPIWNAVITGIYNNQDMLRSLTVEGQLQSDRAEPPAGMSQVALCDVGQLREPALDCSPNTREWMLDGPAGVPDGNGGLIFPQQQPPPPQQPPAAGPWLQEIEPDIYRVLVQPIPPEIASQIQFQLGTGQSAPPAPLYCQVPIEAAGIATSAREQLFIAPPQDPDDAARAEQYARNSGYAFLPTIACDQTLLAAQPVGGSIVITAVIQSPQPGQVITEAVPIIGTAQFSPDQALYYKLEISGGQFGGEWVTIGETHSNSVVNGQLEVLPGPPGLQPGNYQLRLVVVGHDGNFVQPPYTIPFSVQ